jgi:hypothetical protein
MAAIAVPTGDDVAIFLPTNMNRRMAVPLYKDLSGVNLSVVQKSFVCAQMNRNFDEFEDIIGRKVVHLSVDINSTRAQLEVGKSNIGLVDYAFIIQQVERVILMIKIFGTHLSKYSKAFLNIYQDNKALRIKKGL